MKNRFAILKNKYSGLMKLDQKQLKKKFKEGDFVFVCDCTDLFAECVPEGFIRTILATCWDNKDAKFLFQTKNPEKMYRFTDQMPKNSVICLTLETNRNYPNISFTSTQQDKAKWFYMIPSNITKWITIEPIIDFDMKPFIDLVILCSPKQVNIGANTSNVSLPEPSDEKIHGLIETLQKFTTVHIKDNLKRLLK